MKKNIRSGFVDLKQSSSHKVSEDPNTLKAQECRAWLHYVMDHYGDYMPDELTVCVPVYNRKRLFHWYTASPLVASWYKYNEFLRMLGSEFSYMSFKKFKKFMQCHDCNQFDKQIKLGKVPGCVDHIVKTFCISHMLLKCCSNW
jgi:biotin synthase-related radical SAM superfamily protein